MFTPLAVSAFAARAIREKLLARDPKNAVWRRLVAWSDSKISYAHWVAGDLVKSRKAGESALDLRQQLHDESPDQALIRTELALEEERGKRYSFGYSACPDLADQAKLFQLLAPESAIGVTLTSAYQLVPEASTSALIVHHPQASYYMVRE